MNAGTNFWGAGTLNASSDSSMEIPCLLNTSIDIFTYGRDSSSPSTFIVTSLIARGAANRSPEMNWELMSPRIVTSPPLRGPLTSTSKPCLSEIARASAPSVLIAFTSGSSGLLASLGLQVNLTVFSEVDEIAVRNLRVAPDSPQSMGLLVVVGLLIP